MDAVEQRGRARDRPARARDGARRAAARSERRDASASSAAALRVAGVMEVHNVTVLDTIAGHAHITLHARIDEALALGRGERCRALACARRSCARRSALRVVVHARAVRARAAARQRRHRARARISHAQAQAAARDAGRRGRGRPLPAGRAARRRRARSSTGAELGARRPRPCRPGRGRGARRAFRTLADVVVEIDCASAAPARPRACVGNDSPDRLRAWLRVRESSWAGGAPCAHRSTVSSGSRT